MKDGSKNYNSIYKPKVLRFDTRIIKIGMDGKEEIETVGFLRSDTDYSGLLCVPDTEFNHYNMFYCVLHHKSGEILVHRIKGKKQSLAIVHHLSSLIDWSSIEVPHNNHSIISSTGTCPEHLRYHIKWVRDYVKYICNKGYKAKDIPLITKELDRHAQKKDTQEVVLWGQ